MASMKIKIGDDYEHSRISTDDIDSAELIGHNETNDSNVTNVIKRKKRSKPESSNNEEHNENDSDLDFRSGARSDHMRAQRKTKRRRTDKNDLYNC